MRVSTEMTFGAGLLAAFLAALLLYVVFDPKSFKSSWRLQALIKQILMRIHRSELPCEIALLTEVERDIEGCPDTNPRQSHGVSAYLLGRFRRGNYA